MASFKPIATAKEGRPCSGCSLIISLDITLCSFANKYTKVAKSSVTFAETTYAQKGIMPDMLHSLTAPKAENMARIAPPALKNATGCK